MLRRPQGSRVGIWRILDLFEGHDIPITFYAVARAFERNRDVAQAALQGGHEGASPSLSPSGAGLVPVALEQSAYRRHKRSAHASPSSRSR